MRARPSAARERERLGAEPLGPVTLPRPRWGARPSEHAVDFESEAAAEGFLAAITECAGQGEEA